MPDIVHLYPYTNPHELNLDWIIENVKKLKLDFATLKSWCENYLDNLDISQDVDAKIREMAEDGSLTSIVEAAVKSITEPLVDAAIPEIAIPLIEAAINSKIGDIDSAIDSANNATNSATTATASASSAANNAENATTLAKSAANSAASAAATATEATTSANNAAQQALNAAALLNSYSFTYSTDPEKLTSTYDIASEIIPKLNRGFPLSLYTTIGNNEYPIRAIHRPVSTDTVFYFLFEQNNYRYSRVPHYFEFDGGTDLTGDNIPTTNFKVFSDNYTVSLSGVLNFTGTGGGFVMNINVQQGTEVPFSSTFSGVTPWKLLFHCRILASINTRVTPARSNTFYFCDSAQNGNLQLQFLYDGVSLTCTASGTFPTSCAECYLAFNRHTLQV